MNPSKKDLRDLSSSKNFKKGLSKTVAPLYFADTYAHRHTWIPHKARCRFSNDGYGGTIPEHALPRRDSGPDKARCRFMEEWRFIDFGLVDIRDMMAMDEAILKGDEGNTFFFWTPKKSIILGFFQKADVELNLANCRDYTITRRISGGGIAFSDDRGRQINYGVVGAIDNCQFPLDIIESYKQICGVIIDTLIHYGLDAAFRPINDIVVDSRKISGNAQTRWEGKLLQNGTLLLDFDIEEMLRISNIPVEKFLDKKIASIREGLTWLDRELGEQKDMEEVKNIMKRKFEERFHVRLKTGTLSQREKALTNSLLPKYYSHEWTYR